MKFVITGGTGFIGAGLVRNLSKDHEMIVLSRSPQTSAQPSVKIVTWDAATLGDWTRAIEGADVVLNFAGESVVSKLWTPKQKEHILESRKKLTRLIVQAIQKSRKKPSLLINASATGYYAPQAEHPILEDSPAGSDFLATVCKTWEGEALQAASTETRVVLLRLGIVLGLNGGILKRLIPLFSWWLGACPGTGKQWFPWIHYDELAEIVRFLIAHCEITGPVNAVSPNPVTMEEFTKRLAFYLHRPQGFHIPEALIQTLLGDLSEMILSSQRVIPEKLLQAQYPFRFATLDSALANLCQHNPHETSPLSPARPL